MKSEFCLPFFGFKMKKMMKLCFHFRHLSSKRANEFIKFKLWLECIKKTSFVLLQQQQQKNQHEKCNMKSATLVECKQYANIKCS